VRLGDGRALVRVEIREERVGFGHAPDRTGRVRRSPGRCVGSPQRLWFCDAWIMAAAPETREDPE
jgi:hypothetical protein